jgi:hypothetical protein
MATSRRSDIINLLVTELKKIDGGTSDFDSSYTFNTDLSNNVERKIRFLDEVNDFPSLYIAAGTEIRDFNSQNLTNATLDATIRAYVFSEDKMDDLIQDIEHVIYRIGDNSDKGIQEISISNISADEGLFTPYGLSEIEVLIDYILV